MVAAAVGFLAKRSGEPSRGRRELGVGQRAGDGVRVERMSQQQA